MLRPLIKNEIIPVLSSYSSAEYLSTNTSIVTTLEAEIKAGAEEKVSLWTDMEIQVILSSIVCEGVSVNTEFVERKIEGLTAKSERVKSQTI